MQGGLAALCSLVQLLRLRAVQDITPACEITERATQQSAPRLRGLMRQSVKGRVWYHIRMGWKGLVIESPRTTDLASSLHARSEVTRCKADGKRMFAEFGGSCGECVSV